MKMADLPIVNPNLTFQGSFAQNNPEHIIIHHALKSNCTVHDVHRWHLNNGWNGIGYHYFINKKGIVFRGRQDHQSGAHAPPLNRRSLGICLEGCYQEYKNETDRVVPQAQLEALITLVKLLMNRHDIPIEKVQPHSDYSSKLCPGNYFPWDKFIYILGGESELEDYAVIYFNLDDFPAACRLADRLKCGTFSYFVAKEREIAKLAFVVGGDGKDIKGSFKLLSGQNIWETYDKVEAEMRQR